MVPIIIAGNVLKLQQQKSVMERQTDTKNTDFSRIFRYSVQFYLEKQKMISLFSIPFILAFLILILASAPTYLGFGGVFLRTGSLPDMSVADLTITLLGYGIAVFLISDTIVNINLIVKSKRTMTEVKSDVIKAMSTYALRIFVIYTIMLAIMFLLQVTLYESPMQSVLYPAVLLILSLALFFVAPALVIDEASIFDAIIKSIDRVMRKPAFAVAWILIGFLALSLTKLIGDLLFSGTFSGYFVLLVNSLLVLPFLTVLQTQMYMEKYPLAR